MEELGFKTHIHYAIWDSNSLQTSTREVPFKTPQMQSTRDHNALYRNTLGGSRDVLTYLDGVSAANAPNLVEVQLPRVGARLGSRRELQRQPHDAVEFQEGLTRLKWEPQSREAQEYSRN